MEKSEILKRALPKEAFLKMCEICKKSENTVDASEKTIWSTREMITSMSHIQESLGSNPEPTSYIYMERIIHSLQVFKNQ